MISSDHSLLSSYREALLEHLFAGEVMKHAWLSGARRLEVLKPQVDDGGYDLVFDAGLIVRHVQLKATFKGSKVRRFSINAGLGTKPSGCVICIIFDSKTLALGPFYWFGAEPSMPLPDLTAFPIAKHTKGNAEGVKTPRPNIRVVPLSAFKAVPTTSALCAKLFGSEATAEIPGS